MHLVVCVKLAVVCSTDASGFPLFVILAMVTVETVFVTKVVWPPIEVSLSLVALEIVASVSSICMY